jgi:hypothetical protein
MIGEALQNHHSSQRFKQKKIHSFSILPMFKNSGCSLATDAKVFLPPVCYKLTLKIMDYPIYLQLAGLVVLPSSSID